MVTSLPKWWALIMLKHSLRCRSCLTFTKAWTDEKSKNERKKVFLTAANRNCRLPSCSSTINSLVHCAILSVPLKSVPQPKRTNSLRRWASLAIRMKTNMTRTRTRTTITRTDVRKARVLGGREGRAIRITTTTMITTTTRRAGVMATEVSAAVGRASPAARFSSL